MEWQKDILNTEKYNLHIVLKFCLAGLFLWLVFAKALGAYYAFMNGLVGHDTYEFFEATKELALHGINRLTYWPNSTAALDNISWGLSFPPYLYAMFNNFIELHVQDLIILSYIEFILLILVLFMVMNKLFSFMYAFMLTVIILYEPLFNFLFVDHYIYRWSIIFAMISITFFLSIIGKNGRARISVFSYLTGLFAAMSPLSYISFGIPFFLGISAAFIIENYIHQPNKRVMFNSVFLFILGVLTPLLLFGFHIVVNLDSDSLYSVYYTITQYGKTAANRPDISGMFLKMGYFFSSIIASPYVITILPIGIISTIINAYHRKYLGESERILVRITVVFTAVWILLAMVMSEHIMSHGMITVLPLYILQIIISIKYKSVNIYSFYSFLASCLIILFVQSVYHLSGKPGAPYGIGVAALIAITLSILAFTLIKKLLKENKNILSAHVNITDYVIISIILITLIIPYFIQYGKDTYRILNSNELAFGKAPFVERLSKEIKEISKRELKPGDRVLANLPFREFFPGNVRRQLIYFYHGIYGGATKEPANKVFLFGKNPTTNIYPNYTDVRVEKNVYYRGFIYHIDKRIDLQSGYYLLIGKPVPAESVKEVIYPKDYIPKEDVDKYLKWRISNGLTLN